MNESTQKELTSAEKTEYEQANEWWRTLSQLRRRDIALFTAAQGAVLTILKGELLALKPYGYALSAIAFFIAVIGVNNERRLYRYLHIMRARAMAIEKEHGMSLLTAPVLDIKKLRFSLGSSVAFSLYYGLLGVGWLLLWAMNIIL